MSRTGQLVQLYYDSQGRLEGGELQMALPDTWRLLKQGRRSGEPTFPIFYQVQAALGKSCLFLPPRELASNSLFTPLQDEREQAAALQDWTRVCVAMEVLGIDQDEEESFWLIMAAITDLGVIAQKMEDTSCYDCEPAVVDKISGILGVTVDMFHKVVRRPDTPRVTTPVTSAAQSTASSRCNSPAKNVNQCGENGGDDGGGGGGPHVLENIKRLVQNLYSDLLARLVFLINRSIQPPTPARHSGSILLLDSPGFQNPNLSGGKHSAGLVELSYNYLQERLQHSFINSRVERLGEKEKGLAKLFASARSGTNPMLNLLERTDGAEGTQTLGRRRSKKVVRFSQSPPGLLSLLHRATQCPWSDDRTFTHRLLCHWAHQGSLIRRHGEQNFILNHLQGSAPVSYSALGWRQLSHNMTRTNLAAQILSKSSNEVLRRGVCDPFNPRSSGLRSLSLDELKAKMSCLQVKVQIDSILKVVASTNPTFIICLQPHNLSGLCELYRNNEPKSLNQMILREQLRGYQILDYLLIMREIERIKKVLQNREEAREDLEKLINTHMARSQPNNSDSLNTLGKDLLHGLQVGMMTVLNNLELMDKAVDTIRNISGISPLPVSPSSLDPVLLLENGRVLLSQL